MSKEFWDERYRHESYAFGENPNNYFKEQILKLNPGKIILPAEGEGRNAVFAAKLGWSVSAFDISEEGKKKTEKLAKKNNVVLDYRIGDLTQINYKEQQFDALGLIYAHFPKSVKSIYHKQLINYMKSNGIVILEAFSKKHLEFNSINIKVGGPKDINLLYSVEDVKTDFKEFKILELQETEIELNEGLYHIGRASVIRFVGQKK